MKNYLMNRTLQINLKLFLINISVRALSPPKMPTFMSLAFIPLVPLLYFSYIFVYEELTA